MLSFIAESIGTIIVGLGVLAVAAAIVIKLLRDRKSGKSIGCGCSCDNCCKGGGACPGTGNDTDV